MKTTLLKIAAAAAGITLVLCLVAGYVVWHTNRPKSEQPWNDKALIVVGPPGFGTYSDTDYHFYLAYPVRNTTARDWSVASSDQLIVLSQQGDETLASVIPIEHVEVRTPIFIPANQTGMVILHFKKDVWPKQAAGEADAVYHERLRDFLNTDYLSLKGFVVFDDGNRMRIDLPSWARKKPDNAREIKADKLNP